MPETTQDNDGFSLPIYTLDARSLDYDRVLSRFKRLKWSVKRPRKDYLHHRFNAFCCFLMGVQEGQDGIFHTILNKSHYNVVKWPVPYVAIVDVKDQLLKQNWIVVHSERQANRNQRFKAPLGSPLRLRGRIKFFELQFQYPVVSIKRQKDTLDRAPLDIETMANPKWSKYIKDTLLPPVDDLNDLLLNHSFEIMPFRNVVEDTEVQYQRIYTNISGLRREPKLLHGRLYPYGFNIPSKANGLRQQTLIDGQKIAEVDVHASSLTLLSNYEGYRFALPNTEDYYQVGALEGSNRQLVKTIIQCFLNGVQTTRKTWPKTIAEDEKLHPIVQNAQWSTYKGAILEVYPVLASVHKNMGMELMLVESDIILNAMTKLLTNGIGCLSLHDCLMVPEGNVQDAIDAFQTAYKEKGYTLPKLSVTYSDGKALAV